MISYMDVTSHTIAFTVAAWNSCSPLLKTAYGHSELEICERSDKEYTTTWHTGRSV